MKATESTLAAERAKAGWSQRELGSRSGLTQATISRLESGIMRPTLEQAWLISQALGFSGSLAELFDMELED